MKKATPAALAALAAAACALNPDRIDLYTARQGDTWASIAERGGGLVKPATLAIMNDYEPNQAPRPGDRIRIVIEG